jgi:hypothetical protein
MELVDIRDLKSLAPSGRAGSTPAPGTSNLDPPHIFSLLFHPTKEKVLGVMAQKVRSRFLIALDFHQRLFTG